MCIYASVFVGEISEDNISGATVKLISLKVKPEDLKFITSLKRSSRYTETFINNEFVDLYILRTDKSIDDIKYQEEEISEIMYVPYKKFKEMVKNRQSDLLMHDDEFEILFNMFDKEYDK